MRQTRTKELLFNAIILSMILAIVIAAVGAQVETNNSDSLIHLDWSTVFIFYWFIFYMYHLAVSVFNYVLAEIENITARLLWFNAAGLLIGILAGYYISSVAFLAAYFSFLVFSVVAVVVRWWGKRE